MWCLGIELPCPTFRPTQTQCGWCQWVFQWSSWRLTQWVQGAQSRLWSSVVGRESGICFCCLLYLVTLVQTGQSTWGVRTECFWFTLDRMVKTECFGFTLDKVVKTECFGFTLDKVVKTECFWFIKDKVVKAECFWFIKGKVVKAECFWFLLDKMPLISTGEWLKLGAFGLLKTRWLKLSAFDFYWTKWLKLNAFDFYPTKWCAKFQLVFHFSSMKFTEGQEWKWMPAKKI